MTKKLIIVILILSCNPEKEKLPENILTKDQIIPVLIDIHIAEANLQIEAIAGDSAVQRSKDYYAHIYKLHSVTEKQFEESFDYYCRNLNLMHEIYDRTIEELSKKESRHLGDGNIKSDTFKIRKYPFFKKK